MTEARVDKLESGAAGLAPSSRDHARSALAVLLVCAGYYVTGVVALGLRLESGGVSTIWLPHGILLGALILSPVRLWWIYLAALLTVHLHLMSHFEGPIPFEVVLTLFGGNAAQSVLGAIAVQRLVGRPPRLDAFRSMIVFVVFGVILPAFVVAAVASGLFMFAGWLDDFWLAWRRCVLSDVCGALMLTPLIVGLGTGGMAEIRAATLKRQVEFALITVGIVLLVTPALTGEWDLASQQALLFAPLPLLLWTAVRFGPGALGVEMLIVALAALLATKAGHGPFVAASTAQSVLPLQAYLLAILIPKLLLAALVADRNRTARAFDERLKFERLVSELSTSLINPPRRGAGRQVEDALHKALSAMSLDRCSVYQYRSDQRCCTITHSAQSGGHPPVRREIREAELPWLLGKLTSGATVVLDDVARDLPAEAIAERQYARTYGSRAWLAVPVTFSRDIVRAVSYHCAEPRIWSAELVARLQLLAEIFVSSVTSAEAEAALQASEQRYREVVESQTELVCRYLPDTTLTFVNEAYCRYFGRAREELIGHRFVELIPVPARPAVLNQVGSLLREPRVCAYEHEVTLPDGTIGWQHWVDSVIVAPDGRVAELQGIGRDITDRKRAEEATQKLARVSRIAMMGELTASIAHEVNQPLNAILNNADAADLLLEQGPGQLEEVRRILADIRSEDLRASEVIRRTRELLSKRPLERRPLDLNELASSILQLVGNDAIRREVALATEFQDLPVVLGDRVHLQQVLLNLVLNGMEAMAETPHPRRRLTVRTARGDGDVEIAVFDDGHGIDPDRQAELFDSFFTTKKDGMGMGLSIARFIVEAHGGRIWAENRREGGAVFRFTVPVEPA